MKPNNDDNSSPWPAVLLILIGLLMLFAAAKVFPDYMPGSNLNQGHHED